MKTTLAADGLVTIHHASLCCYVASQKRNTTYAALLEVARLPTCSFVACANTNDLVYVVIATGTDWITTEDARGAFRHNSSWKILDVEQNITAQQVHDYSNMSGARRFGLYSSTSLTRPITGAELPKFIFTCLAPRHAEFGGTLQDVLPEKHTQEPVEQDGRKWNHSRKFK